MKVRKYSRKVKPVLQRIVLHLLVFCMLTGCLTGYIAPADDAEVVEAATGTCPKPGMEISSSSPYLSLKTYGTALKSFDISREIQSFGMVFTEDSPLFELFGGSYPKTGIDYDVTDYINDSDWMSENGDCGRVKVKYLPGSEQPRTSPLSCSVCGSSITYYNRKGEKCPATVYILPDDVDEKLYYFDLIRTGTEPYEWTMKFYGAQASITAMISGQEYEIYTEVMSYNAGLYAEWQKECESFNNSYKPEGFSGSAPVEPVDKYRSYPEYHIYTESELANLTHTYVCAHSCGDSCKERLHTHELKYEQEQKVYEYECPGTLTTLSTETRSYSGACPNGCGKTRYFRITEAECACGEKIQIRNYTTYCKSSCVNKTYVSTKNGETYVQFTWDSHPITVIEGVHEETCGYTSTYISGSLLDTYYVGCPVCGTIFSKNTYLYSRKVNTRDGTVAEDYYDSEIYATAGSSHSFTWRDTAEDSCYYQGPVVQVKETSSKSEKTDGGSHVEIYCKSCDYHGTNPLYAQSSWFGGYSQYQYFYSGPSYKTYVLAQDMPTSYRAFSPLSDDFNWLDAKIGDTFIRYDHRPGSNARRYVGNRNSLSGVYHRYDDRVPVCGLLEYGEKVCDKVVTKIVPLEDTQILSVGDELNAQAYVKYLNNIIEGLVLCDVAGFDPTAYNEWQTVTLSYGEYSSVSSRTPQKVTIQVYVERTDADLTLIVEPEGAGTVNGAGIYQVGMENVKASTVGNPGYTFDGWYDEDGTCVSTDTDYSFTMPREDITLTAKYTANSYKVNAVSEYAEMGSVVAPESALYKSSVTVKAIPADGYVFEGWYDGVQKVSSDSSYTFIMPCYDVELKARFSPPYITVSFNSNGGSSCSSINVQHLGTYGVLPTPTRSGFFFVGWKYNGEYINPLTTVLTKSNHTLFADWIEAGPEFIFVDYDNIYGKNSWSLDSFNIGKYGLTSLNIGNKLPFPPNVFKLGYSFKGWHRTENAQGNGDGEQVTEATLMKLSKEHTLYAKWMPNSYTLSFDSNGGSSCKSMIITYDRRYGYHSPLPVPSPEPDKIGYTFAGWYLTESGDNGYGTQIKNNTRVQTIRDQTVYARWVKDAINIKVEFSASTKEQAGLTEAESAVLGFGSTIGTLSGTSVFELTYPGTYGNYPITWCRCEDDETHVAANGWKFFDSQHYYVHTEQLPTYSFPTVARVGYNFDNYWETSGGIRVSKLTDAVVLAQDHTLYAHYTPKQYTVKLDGRGATNADYTKSVTMTFDTPCPSVAVLPIKTGYTFHGYYSGIKGTGTKYYDAFGKSVKSWMETEVTVLYAYWIPNDIELPEEDDYVIPEEEEKVTVEGTVERTDGKGLLYADDYNAATGALTDLQPYLTYDTPGSDGVIPGTELLSFRARMGSWMLNYKFHKNTGIDNVTYIVTVPYIIQYETADENLVTEEKTGEYSFTVPKTYSYWEVLESGMYYPDSVTITNDVLEERSITVPVVQGVGNIVETPDYTVKHYGNSKNHIRWPEYVDGKPVIRITADEQYIISYEVNKKPNVTKHLTIACKNAAWADDTEAEVRSDRYEFNGEIILSDEYFIQNGAELDESKLPASTDIIELTSYEQTYKSGIELDELKPNETYETTAEITYKGDASNVGVAPFKEVVLSDVNDLKIHTPVACTGVAVNGIGTENGENTIVLKEALNFFTLRVDNTGTHLLKLGYGSKDFRTALSGRSNVAEKDGSLLNQVKFPFDVYVDNGNNSLKPDGTYDTTGDYYFEAGTWLIIGSNEQQFYVPVTQKNGTFQIEFRSIAINCITDWTDDTQVDRVEQSKVNTNSLKYIATDCMEIKIKSYLKDFKITHTNDPTALKQLRDGCQALTLKKGYEFSYEVLTQGEFYGEHSEIEVTPSYYWISKDETKRQKAEVYRLRQIPDKEWKECYAWESEPLLEKFENWECILQRWCGSGAIPSDILCIASDTRQGDCMKCKERRYVSGEQVQCEICKSSLQNVEPFSLEEYVSMQTLTGKEEFFKQEGYLMIHFEIRIKSEEKVWYTFDEWRSTELAKDALAAGWRYITGDIIRYDLSAGMADDYEIGGME